MKIPSSIFIFARAALTAMGILSVLILVGAVTSPRPTPQSHAQNIKTVLCDSSHNQIVKIGARAIVTLSFPVKPKDVIPGENSFDFHRIGNDLVIKPLRANSNTTVLVYMAERRCAFELKTVLGAGDGILTVEDPGENLFEAKFQ